MGIDLDSAIDDNGAVKPWAQQIVDLFGSYAEYSISGRGLHIFVRGDIPVDGRKKKLSEAGEAIELYKARRYFAMTGNVYNAAPIEARQAELDRVYSKYFPAAKPQPDPPQPPPPEMGGKDYLAIGLEKDAKFRALWDGERPKEDESANDMSLMNKLAYWCNRDISAMIAAFMRSPFVVGKGEKHTAKLKRADYLQRTAHEAAAKMGATAAQHDRDYQQGKKAAKKDSSSGGSLKPDEFTDAGNAAIFACQFANKAVFVPSMGWLVWNGKQWIDNDLDALGLALELTREMLLEARAECVQAKKSDDAAKLKAAKQFYKHMHTSRNQPQIERLLELSKSHLQRVLEDLDADPHILNTPAGIVDLKTGNISLHDPAKLCTKITKYSPGDKGADEWRDFLKVITCGEDKLIWFLQQLAGMAAVGRVYCENLVIAYGEGNNGKSTFFNTIRAAMGSYGGTIKPEILTTSSRENKGAHFAELKGKRLVIAAELEEGTRLSSSALKQLTSTDPIEAEPKYRRPESFTPTHSLVLFTNNLFRVGNRDNGTWRRILVCPFDAEIKGDKEIMNYSEQLLERCGEAVLSWIIAGAVEFCKSGHRFFAPEIIMEATEEYQDDNDWLREFIAECCELSPAAQARGGELYTAFKEWAQARGEYVRYNHDFTAELKRQGLRSHRNKHGTHWQGIAVINRVQEHYRYCPRWGTM